jgi:hypothetical protein
MDPDWSLFEAPDGELRDGDVDVDVDYDHPLCPSLPSLFPSSPVRSSVKAPATSVSTMAAAGVSPSSSPRLPSPPPFTEVQIGPKSPTVGESLGSAEQLLAPLAETDDGSTRRIRPGTKAADMASGPPLVPLSQVRIYCKQTRHSILLTTMCYSSIRHSSYKNISKRFTTTTQSPIAHAP